MGTNTKWSTGLVIVLGLALLAIFASRRLEKRNPSDFDFEYNRFTERDGSMVWVFEGKYKPIVNQQDEDAFIASLNNILQEVGLIEWQGKTSEAQSQIKLYEPYQYHWSDEVNGSLHVTVDYCTGPNQRDYLCITHLRWDPQPNGV